MYWFYSDNEERFINFEFQADYVLGFEFDGYEYYYNLKNVAPLLFMSQLEIYLDPIINTFGEAGHLSTLVTIVVLISRTVYTC